MSIYSHSGSRFRIPGLAGLRQLLVPRVRGRTDLDVTLCNGVGARVVRRPGPPRAVRGGCQKSCASGEAKERGAVVARARCGVRVQDPEPDVLAGLSGRIERVAWIGRSVSLHDASDPGASKYRIDGETGDCTLDIDSTRVVARFLPELAVSRSVLVPFGVE